MDQILLTFDYVYPYWDMNKPNGAADTNPYIWNYNNSQLEYLLNKKNAATGRPVNVLTHSYGEKTDLSKIRYTLFGTMLHNFYAWNYVHPMMQDVTYYDILEEPFGMLLRKEQRGELVTGYFTGSTISLNESSHTSELMRDEPAYYYGRPITIDGDMADWTQADQLYAHYGASYGDNQQYWGAAPNTFKEGTFDNIKVVSRDGNEVLELEADGAGTRVGPVVGQDLFHYPKTMDEIVWNSSGEGTAAYYMKVQNPDGSWSDWLDVSSGSGGQFFQAFQVKVVLQSRAANADAAAATNGKVDQGISFWGSSHLWKIQLSDNVNLQGIWVTDDSKYLYLRYKMAGQIDFSLSGEVPPHNFYNLYIDSDPADEAGYRGSWWNSDFGAKYRILNNGLYKWREAAADPKDESGWEWAGAANISYKKSAAGDEIEFKIRKSTLGGLNSKVIRIYMFNEEAATHYGGLAAPGKLDSGGYFSGALNHEQKIYKPRVPHGYLQSEEIAHAEGASAKLQWKETKPAQTDVKSWMRTRSAGGYVWNDWTEAANGQVITGKFDYIQYAVGLYTQNGEVTPEVSDVQLWVEDAARP